VIRTTGLLAGLGLLLSGCGLPPAVVVAGYGADLVLYGTTGKSSGEHFLSDLTASDCGFWRVLRSEPLCSPPSEVVEGGELVAGGAADSNADPIGALLDGQQLAARPPGSQMAGSPAY
jgi:hypothetical protein